MIDIKNSLITEQILENYRELRHSYVQNNFNVIVSHFGVFTQDLVNSIVEGNETLMISQGDSKTLRKRVFSILIEGLQNIRKHGEKDEFDRQVAFLLITKKSNFFKINFGNIIFTNEIEIILNQIKHINELPESELKEFYLKELAENVFTKKGGAGLGFIIMKMKSKNILVSNIKEIDSIYSFFSVEVSIEIN